jgi:hypothetical protein
MGIVDTSTPDQYSPAERLAARESLRKSRFFLVLGLGAGLGSEENPPPSILCTCSNPGALLKVVTLESKKWRHNQNARICIELKGRGTPKARLSAANKIVSTIGGLFAHVHHTSYHIFTPYQIPKEFIKGAEMQLELLDGLDDLTGDPYGPDIKRELRSFIAIPDQAMAAIFYLLPFALQNEDLFNACSFFRSCCSDYNFMDGVVGEVLHEPGQHPDNESERLALENVVLQSFRVVEAIAGEPGNEQRFRQRLKLWGISYDERVGFQGRRKQKLGHRICWLQDARDSAAAHGRRRRRIPFSMYEAMEAQHLADTILHRALWFAAESLGRVGDEAEMAFLLAEMFPSQDNPNWTSDNSVFRGESAVDLARQPGGLAKVFKYHASEVRRRPSPASSSRWRRRV